MKDAQWGEPAEDLAISISVAEPVYRPGDSIFLNIVLKNVGETPVPVVVRSAWIDYAFSVWRKDGTELSNTLYAQQMIDRAYLGRRTTRQLMPEGVITDTLELDRAYDMKAPGVYKVIATRQTYKKGKLNEYATVSSNELIIQIVEKKRPENMEAFSND